MSHCTGIDRTLTRTRYSSSLGEPPLVRHAIKSCEAGKSKIKGRIQDVPSRVQGLFVTFASVGSGDPVRVLRLFHNKYAAYN